MSVQMTADMQGEDYKTTVEWKNRLEILSIQLQPCAFVRMCGGWCTYMIKASKHTIYMMLTTKNIKGTQLLALETCSNAELIIDTWSQMHCDFKSVKEISHILYMHGQWWQQMSRKKKKTETDHLFQWVLTACGQDRQIFFISCD